MKELFLLGVKCILSPLILLLKILSLALAITILSVIVVGFLGILKPSFLASGTFIKTLRRIIISLS